MGAFNRLVRLRNQVRAGWSDIDVQLTRRHDLVPMLVEAVRAYAGHEQSVFERVAALRTEALGASSPTRLATVETERGAHTLAFDSVRSKVYAFLTESHRAAVFLDQS